MFVCLLGLEVIGFYAYDPRVRPQRGVLAARGPLHRRHCQGPDDWYRQLRP